MDNTSTTQNSKDIKATTETLYNAFTNPDALSKFLAPGDMIGKVYNFSLATGEGYQMSLFYPESDKSSKGKTAEKEDRFNARFIELTPNKKIVQAVTFESSDPAFGGEMIMEITFEPKGSETTVTILFTNIPAGIKPGDNEKGTQLTLEKLANYVV